MVYFQKMLSALSGMIQISDVVDRRVAAENTTFSLWLRLVTHRRLIQFLERCLGLQCLKTGSEQSPPRPGGPPPSWCELVCSDLNKETAKSLFWTAGL